MGLLDGKTALIFGVANKRSIAWGIAQAFHREGARIGLSYAGEVLERRVFPLAESIGCDFVEPCDVTRDEDIEAVARKAEARFGKIDILVHSIAFANRDELGGPFYETTREGFRMALDISAYSFVALARAFQPLLNEGGAMLSMTFSDGATRVAPHYNVMGVAKAALEAVTRYLAYDFGAQGVRVNAISAGPIRTLAAAGVSGFKKMHKAFTSFAPLHQPVTIEDVGDAAVFLCSDMASKITGQILFVDSGYTIMGVPVSEEV